MSDSEFPELASKAGAEADKPCVVDIIRDLVTNKEYGLGREVDHESFDHAKRELERQNDPDAYGKLPP